MFDLDGTLRRTETSFVPAVHAAFAARGLRTPERDDVTRLIGQPHASFESWLRDCTDPEVSASLAREIDVREQNNTDDLGRLFEGVREALEDIAKNAESLAVCSNGEFHYVEQVLVSQHLRALFHDVRARRPGDGTKADLVSDVLRGGAPCPAVVVGDRQEDIEATHAHAVPAIAVTYGYGSTDELVAADIFVRRPSDLPEAIERLLGQRTHL
jgi:phosphoglycolate phosphatase